MKAMSNPAHCMSGCPFSLHLQRCYSIISYGTPRSVSYGTRYARLLKSANQVGKKKGVRIWKMGFCSQFETCQRTQVWRDTNAIEQTPSTHCPARVINSCQPTGE